MAHRKRRVTVSIPSMEAVEQERARLKHSEDYRRALSGTVIALVAVAAIAILAATLLFPILQVTGNSMEPTLEEGDFVLLLKTDHFETGDLCGFYYQNKLLIKRIIGKPGDYIEIDADGNVSVNGEPLYEPYLTAKSLGDCDLNFPYQVPENRYFVMGDHRETSIDSRNSAIGCIEKEQIVGRIVLRFWPLSKISLLTN